MTELDSRREAKNYVDRVLEAQRRHGHAPVLTPDEYEGAIAEAAEVFDRLSRAASNMNHGSDVNNSD
jgi:hypothetical protein